MINFLKHKPKTTYCVLLYKAPTEQWPQEVRGPFILESDAAAYGESLAPGEFPTTRFTVLPYVTP